MKIKVEYSVVDSELLASEIEPGVIVNSIGGVTRKDRLRGRLKKLITPVEVDVPDATRRAIENLTNILKNEEVDVAASQTQYTKRFVRKEN